MLTSASHTSPVGLSTAWPQVCGGAAGRHSPHRQGVSRGALRSRPGHSQQMPGLHATDIKETPLYPSSYTFSCLWLEGRWTEPLCAPACDPKGLLSMHWAPAQPPGFCDSPV